MRKLVFVVVGVVAAAGTLVAGPQAASASVPSGDVVAACDRSGDRQKSDDCLRHSYWGPTKGGEIQGRTGYLQVQAHTTLKGKRTDGTVQFRRVTKQGKGPWIVRSTFNLTGKEMDKGALVPVRNCGVKGFPAGKYEVRAVLDLPTGMKAVRSLPMATPSPSASASSSSVTPTASPSPTATSSASATPATTPSPSATASASATPTTTPSPTASVTPVLAPQVTSDQGSSATTMLTLKSSPACTSSGDDEANVEWFNQMLFEDEYAINVSQSATSFMVQLNCPQPISPAIPPSLGVNLSPFDTITSTSCNSGTPLSINIQGAMSGLYPYCSYQGSVVTCDFEVQAVNTETRLTYSETMMSIQFISLPSQILPQLLPATVPLGLNCTP